MLPAINDTVFFHIESFDEYEAKSQYKSRISDMDEEMLYIEIPLNIETGRFKKLHLGDLLSMSFVTEGGVKYYFQSEVLGYKEEGIRMIGIRKPKEDHITRKQRRNYLRIPANLEIAVNYNGMFRFVSETINVSGGGIAFVYDRNEILDSGKRISCWLLVPYKNGVIEHLPFQGEIIHVGEIEGGKKIVTARFIEITDRDRQKLIQYCFERQLDFRKK